MHTSLVMRAIPDDAALVLEFNNDKSFYDIFNNNSLFSAVVGKPNISDFNTIREELLQNPYLEKFFSGQNIYISIHPLNQSDLGFLFTTSCVSGLNLPVLTQSSEHPDSNLLVRPLFPGMKLGYDIFIKKLKKSFYVIIKDDNIFLGSFSKQLIDQCLNYKQQNAKNAFVLLSPQQNANSLANLYVNYNALTPLFNQLFKNKNTDIFRSFRLLPGLASLTLNYHSDALMFNGSTTFNNNKLAGYLNLFTSQQPVDNHLKDILPSTTAYCTSFAVSNPLKFAAELSQWQTKSGLKAEKDQLLAQIKTETGVNLKSEFNNLLGNEFAIVTTRYLEKIAIISINDGSKMKLLLGNISKMTSENSGVLDYEKLPFYLLGDSFSNFKRPYFMIVDNYLILTNSTGELASYYDIYINRKFLSRNDQYNQFDNLLAERSNVAFIFNFKNSLPILKRDLYPEIYDAIENNEPGWKNFYAASCQLSSADKNFYTNFCIQLNSDTTMLKN